MTSLNAKIADKQQLIAQIQESIKQNEAKLKTEPNSEILQNI